MGVVVFLVIGLYLLIAIGVVMGATTYARNSGKNVKRWKWGAVLIMYLIPCWDLIPTVVSHKFYCATEAGYWTYKSLEQWKMENPGVIETLIDNSPNKFPNWPHVVWRGKEISNINQRFGMLNKNHLSNPTEGELFINVWRWQTELLDKETGEVLARQVKFTTGNEGYIGNMHSLKFWLNSDGCASQKEYSLKFGEYLKNFRGRKNER